MMKTKFALGRSLLSILLITMVAPSFSLDKERYDQTTFRGRYLKMLDVVDPCTLFYSEKTLQDALLLLKQVEQHASLPPNTKDEDLWKAKKVKDSMVHPDTNQIIPRPFRMSGFLPFNAPICVGALMATSTPSILFWQWANQTHNALINYNNRSGSHPILATTLAQSYLGAVTGAISVAMGLKVAIQRNFPPKRAISLQRFVALPAIMTASALNVVLMRRGELSTGVDLHNANGELVGTSQNAAKKALVETTLSRLALPIPIFAFPPIGSALIDAATGIIRGNPRISLAINSFLLLIGFGLGLPAAIAIFPQVGTISVDDLEPCFKHKKDKDGNPLTTLSYNKGL